MIRAAFITVLLFGTPQIAQAQFGFSGDTPVAIKAEKSTYKGGLTVLEGNVAVTQDNATIYSDTMNIYRKETGPDQVGSLKLGEITKIEAIGNFRYEAPENTVTGNRGLYQREAGTIIVTGNVRLVQPSGSSQSAERLVYNLETKTARLGEDCTGENCDRVNFSIKPKQ